MSVAAQEPKVSVCVVTYNQEKYIQKTLNSILAQETDFPYEILVSDDASTDGTRGLIDDMAQRHPGKIKIIYHEKNVGPTQNYIRVHRMAKGKYVAHLDGDDYALPGKLQAQARVLDANPGCTVTWHRMFTESDGGERFAPQRPKMAFFGAVGSVSLALILQAGSVAAASSMMYRRTAMDLDIGDEEVLDYFSAVNLVSKGFGIFLDERLGVYCCSANGMSRTGRAKVQLRFQEHLREFLIRFPAYRSEIFSLAVVKLCKGILSPGKYPVDWALLQESFSIRALPSVFRAFWLAWQSRGPHLTNK